MSDFLRRNRHCSQFAACLWARVISVTDSDVVLASDEAASELVLRINAVREFVYGEREDVPKDGDTSKRVLVAFFEDAVLGDTADRVTFVESMKERGQA
jgi:hypothetical protein